MLRNLVYCGKIKVPAYKDEVEEIVEGIHEALISEDLFYQVQQVANGRRQIKAKWSKQIDELPMRGFLSCSKCGKNLTGSASRGNGGRYFYYHWQPGCDERYSANTAHSRFKQWIAHLCFKPEIAALYLAIIEDTFKMKEGDINAEIAKLEEQIKERTALLDKATGKLLNDDIDKNDFQRTKAGILNECAGFRNRINELRGIESGFAKYSRYGLSLLSNLAGYYEAASVDVKQRMIGSMFPEKLIIKDGKYRTNRPSDFLSLICSIDKGFSGIRKRKGWHFCAPFS